MLFPLNAKSTIKAKTTRRTMIAIMITTRVLIENSINNIKSKA